MLFFIGFHVSARFIRVFWQLDLEGHFCEMVAPGLIYDVLKLLISLLLVAKLLNVILSTATFH